MSLAEFETETVVASLVPRIYAATIRELRWPSDTDMSRGPKCHILTLDLLGGLRRRGLVSRRELHVTESGLWHYVIAHASADAKPTGQDLVTDLSPWQFEPNGLYSGYMHATRDRVQETMRTADVPEEVISLRSVETIALSNCERIIPPPSIVNTLLNIEGQP